MPDSFLKAVLCNDLKGSFASADTDNRLNIFEIVSYIYNEFPSGCWGSDVKVNDWIKRVRG